MHHSHVHPRGAVPGDENLPLPHERRSFSMGYDSRYAFVVDGKTYFALVHNSNTLDPRIPIHYDPNHPGRNIAGELTPPWIILIFALGIGGLLAYFGYQWRTSPPSPVSETDG